MKTSTALQKQASDAIDQLERLKCKHADSTSSRFEQVCNLASSRLLIFSGSFFLLLCLVGLTLQSGQVLPNWGKWAVLILSGIVLASAVVAVVLQVLSVLAFAVLYRRGAPKLRTTQFAHDAANAITIANVPVDALDIADDWLAQKIRRIERRLSFFFGGADKVALFALVGICWTVRKEVLSSSTIASIPTLVVYGLAVLAGMTIGGVGLRMIADRLAYQREVIALAKRLAN
ncbi:hypothetical protein WG899_19585 [Paucibacter sp. AS339]|uniref:hypothetical protein n=1 Tax=Paucibacter hankyongi TaxID=3133434 RepID=UPI0030A01258